jgi:hypothetical protein
VGPDRGEGTPAQDGYRGRCENCGAITSGGDGRGRARERCRRCGARGRQRHSRESIVAAIREWERRFGARPTSYDLSRHWAERRGGAAPERWEVERARLTVTSARSRPSSSA